jgi:hypothetical protein
VIIAPAAPEDLGLLVGFRDEAARWLADRSIDQWQEPYPTEDLMEQGMLRSLRAGESLIVWDDEGTPAATITVDRWANPDLWTSEEAAGPALYAHKLTVAAPTPAKGSAPNCWTGPGPALLPLATAGLGWMSGPLIGSFRTTTGGLASRTYAGWCLHTTLRARCCSDQRAMPRPRDCARLPAASRPGPSNQ